VGGHSNADKSARWCRPLPLTTQTPKSLKPEQL
jgi:hypothetical protein